MRIFNKCLNKERKIFNCSILGIGFGVVGLVLVTFKYGIAIGLGGAVIGYFTGTYLGKCLFEGTLQRYLYWHLPYASIWLDRSVPDSHLRKFF